MARSTLTLLRAAAVVALATQTVAQTCCKNIVVREDQSVTHIGRLSQWQRGTWYRKAML
jgi:hypothetical protein